jgi:class 3 adenylate cyclase/CHASE2 domain-containing sensor protein
VGREGLSTALLRRAASVALLLVVSQLLLTLPDWPLLSRFEAELYDARLALANYLRPARIGMDPRIVVVGIEPESYATIEKHPVFWADLYARAARLALDGGAERVGLDLLVDYVPKEQRQPIGLALLPYVGRVHPIAYADKESGTIDAPHEWLVTLLGVQNLVLANLVLDEDGVARRHGVGYTPSPPKYGRSRWTFLASTLAGQPPEHDLIYPNLTAAEPRRLAFHQFLTGPHRLPDAIVLIGSRARADQDLVITPNAHWRPGQRWTQMGFGVDYHAQVVNTLLQGRPLRPVNGTLPVLVLLTGIFAVARWTSPLVSMATLGAATSVYVGVALAALIHWDRLLPLTPGLVGIPLCWGALTAQRAWRERKERRALLRTIGGYVSPDILKEMLATPSEWMKSLNQRRDVTVLFSDINDFSAVSEREPAETVAAWLNEHYREMAHVIFEHHGTIIRFVGDQFMVLFGSPTALDRPEEAAVRTALAMHGRLEELRASGRPGFHHVKIGIHCGSLLLAVIGDELKRDYTAVGDEANLAARIQDLCKRVGAPTLVSADLVARIGAETDLHFEDMGSWDVKGRVGQVRVFRPGSRPAEPETGSL